MLRVLDLFSGIGGFSLGLERTGGFRTVAFCEIDPYCQAVLRKHWPGVPVHANVCALNAEILADTVSKQLRGEGSRCVTGSQGTSEGAAQERERVRLDVRERGSVDVIC